MPQVLVTGAAGFLGRHVCCHLAAAGLDVLAVDRTPAVLESLAMDMDSKGYCLAGAEAVDLLDEKQLLPFADRWPDVQFAVHLASPVPGSSGDGLASIRPGCDMTINVLMLTDRLPIRHLLYLSSIAVYDSVPNQPLPESTPFGQNVGPYGLSKQLGEQLMRWASCRRGHSLTILRPVQIYGPGEPHGLGLTRIVRQAVVGKPVVLQNGGQDARDLIYVEDVASAVTAAVLKKANGVFNISMNQCLRIADLVEHVAQALQRPLKLTTQPQDQPATRFLYPNGRARDELEFSPSVAWPEGIQRTVAAELECGGEG
jgi:nucleoside-diphosphate-sugar epimerase